MSHIDEFASDVNAIIADLNAQFGALNDMKVALKTQGNDIAAQWSQYFTDQKQAMQAAQDALNRISNVPLSTVSPPIPTSGPISGIPVVKP